MILVMIKNTLPFAVLDADDPSAHLAFTVMVGLPNPKTSFEETVTDPPAAMLGSVPLVSFPARMNPPAKVMFQSTVVAAPVPTLLITAEKDPPPRSGGRRARR